MALEKLSPELILCVASFLAQVDLLNVALTCKHLKDATEPKLYRVFQIRSLRGQNIAEFVLMLAKRPVVAKYVKAIDLAGWQTLTELTPGHYESNYALSGMRTTREEKIDTFDRFHKPQPTEAEYLLLTAAGLANGIIKDVLPYEVESTIIQKVRPMLSTDAPDGLPWFTNIFGDDVTSQNVSFDRKFCQLLRAGIDDAYVVLLLALLSNLNHVFIRGLERDLTALAIPRPLHGFKSLRTLKIGCMDMQYAWGINYIEKFLGQCPLEELYLHNASSWCQQVPDPLDRPVKLRLQPKSLRLRILQMVNCTLRKSDMHTLLEASNSLQSFLYWTSNEETGLENFNSDELVGMLKPFKDTLEELFLEIVPIGMEFEEEGRLITLSHFTALKTLDTTAAMWRDLTDEKLDGQRISTEQLLCHRLPSNLEELILHSPPKVEGIRDDWYMPYSPDKRQIHSIILNHKKALPKLHHVYIGSACEKRGRYLDLLFLEQYRSQYPNLKIIVGKGWPRCAPTRSFFDDFLYAPKPPETKWDGEKYSVLSYNSARGLQADIY